MRRATTLATVFLSCLAVGNGFVLVAPRVTPPEPSRPKQAKQAFSTGFEAAPAEVGGPGVAGGIALGGAGGGAGGAGGGGGGGAKTSLPLVRSAEDHATGRKGSCSDLQGVGEVESELDANHDTTAAVPIAEGTIVMEDKEEQGEEGDWGVAVVPQTETMMRLTVTVEEFTSDTTAFKTKTGERTSGEVKVVATTVHEWTPMDVGKGAEIEVPERPRDNAGTLYGVSVDDLAEQLAKIADATQVQNGQQLTQKVFLAAIDVVCCEVTSRAFDGGQRPVVPSGSSSSSSGAENMIVGVRSTNVPSRKSRTGVLRAHGHDEADFEASGGSVKQVDAHNGKAGGGGGGGGGSSRDGGEGPVARKAGTGSKKEWLSKLWRRVRRKRR